ncbi:uncharacterized protein LOC116425596 isoform X2 [Nomia melanderi]|uniref:uncharacterized protein LOC116425596 isoform X2 n=1 Tax=Nomia melanderi TaxID=2448451 RepID=UPI0013044AAB|nr:uncharacterized protein LOC116425596 isoform X2 [Nomia melanderi]
MKGIQYLYIIVVLYFIGQYTRGVSCAKSTNIKQSALLKDETFNTHNDREVLRSQRELKELNFTTNINNLSEEGRAARSVLGSRRHLKEGDAHQVANYFLTGGPLKGHSHFVGSSNCNSNNDESNIVGLSNPKNANDANLAGKENDNNTNFSDSLVGVPHIPALQPYIPPLNFNNGGLHSVYHPGLATAIPHVPLRGNILRSILHPRFHPHINRLHTLPSTLFRVASLPVHSLANAQSQLQHALFPTVPLHQPLYQPLHQPLLGSPKSLGKSETNLVSDLTNLNGHYEPALGASPTPATQVVHPNYFPDLQPTGYIVKFVPHNRELSSPVVGSSQQSSNCINNNLNAEENVGSVKNKDEDIDIPQQDPVLDKTADSK